MIEVSLNSHHHIGPNIGGTIFVKLNHYTRRPSKPAVASRPALAFSNRLPGLRFENLLPFSVGVSPHIATQAASVPPGFHGNCRPCLRRRLFARSRRDEWIAKRTLLVHSPPFVSRQNPLIIFAQRRRRGPWLILLETYATMANTRRTWPAALNPTSQ